MGPAFDSRLTQPFAFFLISSQDEKIIFLVYAFAGHLESRKNEAVNTTC